MLLLPVFEAARMGLRGVLRNRALLNGSLNRFAVSSRRWITSTTVDSPGIAPIGHDEVRPASNAQQVLKGKGHRLYS